MNQRSQESSMVNLVPATNLIGEARDGVQLSSRRAVLNGLAVLVLVFAVLWVALLLLA
jgi:hypothetical protein